MSAWSGLTGHVNVGTPERWGSTAAGGALLAAAVKRGGLGGILLGLGGAALVQRGVTGHCQVYGALGLDTHDFGSSEEISPSGREVDEELLRRPARAGGWSEVDEALDESFPASDPPSFTRPPHLGPPAHGEGGTR
ncbi:MAG: DUF2892 domain-containing protein [Gemmatimonadota bacterium]|nr:DUF2892 domain-containing protein [Gemmatimonadota bacterium]